MFGFLVFLEIMILRNSVVWKDESLKSTMNIVILSLRNEFMFPPNSHLSTVLGNKFDHGAEAIVPTLFNLVPNSAKVMATSGCAAIKFIIRVGVPVSLHLLGIFRSWLLAEITTTLKYRFLNHSLTEE